MRAFVRSWWFRQGVIFVVAEVLGYLLSIESRERFPQEICFLAVFFVIAMIYEWLPCRKAQRRPLQIESPQLLNAAALLGSPSAAAAQHEAPSASAARRKAPNASAAVVIPLRPPGA